MTLPSLNLTGARLGSSRRPRRPAVLLIIAVAAATISWSHSNAATAIQEQAPSATTCGDEATSWSTATVGGLTGELVRVEDNLASAAGDPPRTRRLAARIAFANDSDLAVALPHGAFAVVACDGSAYAVVADADVARRPPPESLAAGEDAVGWVTFAIPRAAEPTMIVIRLEQDDRCQAWLGFPLRLSVDANDAASGDVAAFAATATPAILGPCAGGSATSGAATSGGARRGGSATGGSATSGSVTGGAASGGDGADAVGGDATGGDGCPGADASGADATGGDGGDGGDAVATGAGDGVVAPDCHNDPER